MARDRRITSLIGISGLFLLGQAQTISGQLIMGRRQPNPLLLERTAADGGLVFISYRSVTSTRGLTLHKYNADWTHEWSLDLPNQYKNEELTEFAVVDTIIWVFTQLLRKKQLSLLAYQITLGGKVIARAREVLRLPLADEKRIELTYSPNRQWACLSFSIRRPADSLDQIGYFVVGVDTTFGGVWTAPYTERDLQILRPLQPGYDGTLYALGKVHQRSSPYPTYVLFRYVPSYNLTLQLPLEVGKLYLINPTFQIEQQRICIAAFYSERVGMGVRGLVFAEVRLPGFFLTINQKTPVPPEILQRYLSERQIARGHGIPRLYLDHLIPRREGGILLIGEQFFITTPPVSVDVLGVWQIRETYHYRDILVFALDSLGRLKWVRVIPKAQRSSFPLQLSYGLLVGPEAIYFIYRSRERGMGRQIFVVSLRENGDISSPRPLIQGFRSSDIFYRAYTQQLSDTEGVIAYYRWRKRQFILVRLELQ
jgi:hypothetical protein